MKKYFVLLLFLVITVSGKAQSIKLEPSFAGLIVKNLDSAILWYSKVLGLGLRNRVDNPSRGFKQAILEDKGIMIELVELARYVSPDSLLHSQPTGTRILGYNKFGFTVKDIEAMFRHLALIGVNFHGKMVRDAISTKKTFLIADPDGNLIQFFEK